MFLSPRCLRPMARGTLAAIACGVLLTNGCVFQHATPYARLQPVQYCPGDTLVAGYDVIGGGAGCVSHSGLDCTALQPTMQITTTSAALPSAELRGFAGERSFAPDEATVSATFTPTPREPVFPTRDVMGREIILSRLLVPTTLTATRIAGGIREPLFHAGMCAGETPVHAPAMTPGAPRLSDRLRARQVCNRSDGLIFVEVRGAGGPVAAGMLALDGCLDFDAPNAGLVVNARAPIAPGMYCGALQNGGPPPPLRTEVVLACGN